MKSSFCYLFSIYLIILYWLVQNGNMQPTGLAYIVAGRWERSFNTFSLVGNLCLFCVFASLISWIEKVLRIASDISDQGGMTVIRLVASIGKYIGVLAACYLAAINFGIDAQTTLTSLGIVGFGITFGAQDIIKDFIAGIFILFEGNYKVGDLIMINGDNYFVRAVGVRTTKVEAWGKIKVINNSQMTGVINIQNSISRVNCDVTISKEYDLENIEQILKEELPKLKDNYPDGATRPIYMGVERFDGIGTTLRFTVSCTPLLQAKMARIMCRDLKMLFDKFDISVPVTAYEIRYVDKKEK